MYLKRLELFGFKSFADKTELEFSGGIAAVIGPNGCGKSNLVDAVRWVLGEQSAKALRGSRMEEIIFSGSDSRKPLNFAEVSLTFNEAGAHLNLDYNEITVTRRLFRSGESEYYINKSPCRLKDITELFLDTGIGKEIYSVIGQGRVEEIINSRPEDRREIFEEAAGILKYKLRKKEARRRLEETRENLVRVQDLIFELETQVEPLIAQAEVTGRYRELRRRIDGLEKELLSYHLQHTREALRKIERQWSGVADALASTAAQGGLMEERCHELKQQQQEQSRAREEVERKLALVSREIEQQESELRLLRDREGRHREQLEQGARRLHKLEEDAGLFQAEKTGKEHELHLKQEAAAAEQERCAALRRELELLEQSSLINEVEEQQQRLYRAVTRQKTAETAVRELVQQEERLSQRKRSLDADREELARRLGLFKPYGEALKAGRDDLAEQAAAASALLSHEAQRLEELRRKLAALAQEEQQHREEMRGVKSRLQLMQEQEAALSGYYRGVREILQARSSLPGIVGPVVDLLTVDEAYTRAIETALGGGLQFIVADTEKAAKEAIRFLKEGNRGWATFLPLDTIRLFPSGLERYQGWRGLEGVLGKASELVRVPLPYQKIADYLLGSIVICRDLEGASRTARFIGYSCRVISLDGDMINPGGAIRGGSIPRRNAGLPLGRRREIESLEEEQAALHKKMASGAEKIESARRELARAEESFQRAASHKAELEEKLQTARREEEGRVKEEEFFKERLDGLNDALRSLDEEEAELKRRREAFKLQEQACLQEISLVEAELAGKKELYQRSLAEKKELENALTTALVGLNSCQEQEQALMGVLAKLETDLSRLRQERLEKQDEAEQIRAELVKNKALQDKAAAALEQLQQRAAGLIAALDEQKKEASLLAAAVVDCEEQERQWRTLMARLEKRERFLAVEQARLKTEIEFQLKRFEELFRSRETVPVPPDFDALESEQELRALKEDLEGLGEVNLGAIEELKRLQERINFLKGQQDDLHKGELSLRRVLAEIDQRMEECFNASFEQIGANMQQVFSELFHGGQVLLRLTDPRDVLESGIEIVAQPPGKRLQNISLLSTGEKVLTAVALIFAILRFKPAPFYLLDEIESALDDVNLARFTAYLKQASREAQFILITHRKRTMEEADVLYGVTMPETGVSRLVSMKLEELAS
jgi:chromosome segregation protein